MIKLFALFILFIAALTALNTPRAYACGAEQPCETPHLCKVSDASCDTTKDGSDQTLGWLVLLGLLGLGIYSTSKSTYKVGKAVYVRTTHRK